MLDLSECEQIERHDNVLSGAWVFNGTRLPVSPLFENLEEGASMEKFLEWFPGVSRDQVVAVLSHVEQSLVVSR